MSNFGAPEGPTLGEMIVNNAKPVPPPAVVEPPAPEIPTNASEATARLAQLQADPKWREAFLRGDGPRAKEFNALMQTIEKGDNPQVDHAIAGVLYDGPFQPSGHMQNIATAQMFRDLGIGDDVTREVLTDREVTQEEYDKVSRLKAERMRDNNWVKEYMAGNGPQRRDMMLMDIVLSSTIKAKEAS
jgi:YD repeat-containing protein